MDFIINSLQDASYHVALWQAGSGPGGGDPLKVVLFVSDCSPAARLA